MKRGSRTFKWITFRVINYLHIVVGFVIMVLMIVGNWPLRFEDSAEFVGFFLAVLGFGVFFANGLSNLYLLERFYPDQLPPPAASRFNVLTHILLVILSLLLAIILIVMLSQQLDNPELQNTMPWIAWLLFGTLVVSSIPIWFMQGNLRSTLKRNYYASFDQFLENDDLPEGENL